MRASGEAPALADPENQARPKVAAMPAPMAGSSGRKTSEGDTLSAAATRAAGPSQGLRFMRVEHIPAGEVRAGL